MRSRSSPDLTQQIDRCPAVSDDLGHFAHIRQPTSQRAVLGREVSVLKRLTDLQPNHIQINGLGHKIECPSAHGFHRHFHGPKGGNDNHAGFGTLVANTLEQLEAVQVAWQAYIGDHKIVVTLLKLPQAFFAAGR